MAEVKNSCNFSKIILNPEYICKAGHFFLHGFKHEIMKLHFEFLFSFLMFFFLNRWNKKCIGSGAFSVCSQWFGGSARSQLVVY